MENFDCRCLILIFEINNYFNCINSIEKTSENETTFDVSNVYIFALIKGKGTFSNSEVLPIESPCVLISKGGVFIPSEQSNFISCEFTGLIFDDYASKFGNLIYSSDVTSFTTIKTVLESFLNNKNDDYNYILLFKELENLNSEKAEIPTLVKNAIEEIEEHYSEFYGVNELAESLNVSISHLVRKFTEHIGITPLNYITTTKINAAKGFLLYHDYSLEEISIMCGFSSSNYFCKVFKKHTGFTPTTFKKSNQNLKIDTKLTDILENSHYL